MNKNITENVVYRYTPDEEPAIRYHSMPLVMRRCGRTRWPMPGRPIGPT